MNVEIKKHGVYSYITIIDGKFSYILCNLGASIYGVKINDTYLTSTPEDKDFFETPTYYQGKFIGRFANRIPGNTIEVDGKKYVIEHNEGKNTLHGGKDGLSTKIFDYKIDEESDKVTVTFSYLSKDLESGFPGNMKVNVRYIVVKGSGELLLDFDAISDKKTFCLLTSHAFFNLGEEIVDNLKLHIKSHNYLNCQKVDLLPLGKLSVPKYLDFSSSKNIGEDYDNPEINVGMLRGYDHYYYFDEGINGYQARLESDKYSLEIYSDSEGCQIYADGWTNKYKSFGTNRTSRRAIAIEAQNSYLNTPLLDANTMYHHYIKFKFAEK